MQPDSTHLVYNAPLVSCPRALLRPRLRKTHGNPLALTHVQSRNVRALTSVQEPPPWLTGNGNQEINAYPSDFLDRVRRHMSKSYGIRRTSLLTVSKPVIIPVLFPLHFHSSCSSFLLPGVISWVNYLSAGLWSRLMLCFLRSQAKAVAWDLNLNGKWENMK